MATKITVASAATVRRRASAHHVRRLSVHSAARRARAGGRALLRRVGHRRHRGGGRAQRQAQRCARSAQRGVGRPAGHPLGHPGSRLEVHRRHRLGELPLHLASAEEPDLDLRRQAENGPLRRSLADPLEQHRPTPSPRRAPDAGVAGRRPQTCVGERGRRHRRAGTRLPLSLHARRFQGRRLPDQHRAIRDRRAAPARRHPQRPATAGRAGQRHRQTGGSDHAARRRQQQDRPGARQPARRGDHPAGRAAADRLSLRPGPDQLR